MARTHALRIKGDEAVLNRSNATLFCAIKCPDKHGLDTDDRQRHSTVNEVIEKHGGWPGAFHGGKT